MNSQSPLILALSQSAKAILRRENNSLILDYARPSGVTRARIDSPPFLRFLSALRRERPILTLDVLPLRHFTQDKKRSGDILVLSDDGKLLIGYSPQINTENDAKDFFSGCPEIPVISTGTQIFHAFCQVSNPRPPKNAGLEAL